MRTTVHVGLGTGIALWWLQVLGKLVVIAIVMAILGVQWVVLAIIAALCALVSWLHRHHSVHGRDEGLDAADDISNADDSTVLVLCGGCGCRHRRAWMDWTPQGTYRCVVCCKDGDGAQRDRLADMYPEHCDQDQEDSDARIG